MIRVMLPMLAAESRFNHAHSGRFHGVMRPTTPTAVWSTVLTAIPSSNVLVGISDTNLHECA
jgi:hypothetical protein